MLRKLVIRNFKSLHDVEVNFPSLTVLFGPNAAGKSNLLDAIQALSRIGTCRTLSDALSDPIRGRAVETFEFPSGGLPGLLSQPTVSFELAARMDTEKEVFDYRIVVAVQTGSGALSVMDEYLALLNKRYEPKGNPCIEKVQRPDGKFELRIRRKSKPAKPRTEPVGLNYSLLSDPRLSGPEYRSIEKCRNDLIGWRVYYLDPRTAMRTEKSPADVRDIGVFGEDIAPFLYRLRGEKEKYFEAVVRTLRTLIPSVEYLTIDLDKRRGTLDILVRQGATDFSSRIVSEGTLRVLALCSIAVNPWGGNLIAFEEPENGVHPRRLELIAELLTSLALVQKKQVVVTTHSPLFCMHILKRRKEHPEDIALFRTRRGKQGTEILPFAAIGPLFDGPNVDDALAEESEDGLPASSILRGLLDE